MEKVNGVKTFSIHDFVNKAESLDKEGNVDQAIKVGSREFHIVGKNNRSSTLLKTRQQFVNALSGTFGANNEAVIVCKDLLLNAEVAKKPLSARTILDMTKRCRDAAEPDYAKGLAKLLKSASECVDEKLVSLFGKDPSYGSIKGATSKILTKTLLAMRMEDILTACGSDDGIDILARQTADGFLDDLQCLMEVAKSSCEGLSDDDREAAMARFVRLGLAAKSTSSKTDVSYRLFKCAVDMGERSPDVFESDEKLAHELLRRIGQDTNCDDLGEAAAKFCEQVADLPQLLREVNGNEIEKLCEEVHIDCDENFKDEVCSDLRKEAVRWGTAVFDLDRLKVAISRVWIGQLINKTIVECKDWGEKPNGELTRQLFDAKVNKMLQDLSADGFENLTKTDGLDQIKGEFEKLMVECEDLTKKYEADKSDLLKKCTADLSERIKKEYGLNDFKIPLGKETSTKLTRTFLKKGSITEEDFEAAIKKQLDVLAETADDLANVPDEELTRADKLLILECQCKGDNPTGNHVVQDIKFLLKEKIFEKMTVGLQLAKKPTDAKRGTFFNKFVNELWLPLANDANTNQRKVEEWGTPGDLLFIFNAAIMIKLRKDPGFKEVAKYIKNNFSTDAIGKFFSKKAVAERRVKPEERQSYLRNEGNYSIFYGVIEVALSDEKSVGDDANAVAIAEEDPAESKIVETDDCVTVNEKTSFFEKTFCLYMHELKHFAPLESEHYKGECEIQNFLDSAKRFAELRKSDAPEVHDFLRAIMDQEGDRDYFAEKLLKSVGWPPKKAVEARVKNAVIGLLQSQKSFDEFLKDFKALLNESRAVDKKLLTDDKLKMSLLKRLIDKTPGGVTQAKQLLGVIGAEARFTYKGEGGRIYTSGNVPYGQLLKRRNCSFDDEHVPMGLSVSSLIVNGNGGGEPRTLSMVNRFGSRFGSKIEYYKALAVQTFLANPTLLQNANDGDVITVPIYRFDLAPENGNLRPPSEDITTTVKFMDANNNSIEVTLKPVVTYLQIPVDSFEKDNLCRVDHEKHEYLDNPTVLGIEHVETLHRTIVKLTEEAQTANLTDAPGMKQLVTQLRDYGEHLKDQYLDKKQAITYSKTIGHEMFRVGARLALLASKLGHIPSINCNYGRDRTGAMDNEIKMLALQIEEGKELAPIQQKSEQGDSDKELRSELLVKNGENDLARQIEFGAPVITNQSEGGAMNFGVLFDNELLAKN